MLNFEDITENLQKNVMKKALLVSVITIITFNLMIQTSCKQVTEDIIQCAAESIGVSVNADLDGQNNKLMHFKFNYDSSDGTELQEIEWDFGDGVKITNNDTIIDHEYANSGHYDASMKYTVKLSNNSTCTSTTTKSINIP